MNNCEHTEEKKTTPNQKITEHFLNNRQLFLSTEINDSVADELIQKMLYLDSLNHEDIILFINSPGGVISSGLAILDVMDAVESDIVTVVTGMAASMAAVILSCGTKGKRYAWPHSRIMIHQPLISGTYRGRADELQTEANEMERMKRELNELLAEKTGQSYEKVVKDTDRDYFLSASEGVVYGLVDFKETKR